MKRIGVWLLAGTFGFGGVAVAGAKEQEEHLTVDQLPPMVRSTFEREASGGKIEELEREQEKGRTIYEGEIRQGKHEVDLKVAEDGTVISRH